MNHGGERTSFIDGEPPIDTVRSLRVTKWPGTTSTGHTLFAGGAFFGPVGNFSSIFFSRWINYDHCDFMIFVEFSFYFHFPSILACSHHHYSELA